ncbi:MAG: hypothetical protein ACXV9P_00510 [Acidimicrobiia bacterium]
MTGAAVAFEQLSIVDIDATILPRPRVDRRIGVRQLTLLTAASWGIWILSLFFIDVNHMTDFGLISVLGPLYFLALAGLSAAFAWTITFHHKATQLLTAQVVSLIVMLYGVTGIVEPEPGYFTAYLHVGFIEYIARTGSTLPLLDARFSWPGSFSLGALLTELAGVKSALYFVRWSPLAFNLLWLLPLWVIVCNVTTNPKVRWVTLWIFPIANWVHQDYLSPQALNYFLYLVVLAVLLRWFRPRILALVSKKPHRIAKAPSFAKLLWADGVADDMVSTPPLDYAQRCGLLVILVVTYFAAVMSHQLTPVVLLITVAVMVFFRRTTLTTLPVIMAVLMLAWISFGAETYWVGHLRTLFGGAGAVSSNLKAGIGRNTTAGEGRTFVLAIRVAFSAGVLAFAALGTLRRWRTGSRQLTCVLLAAAPFCLLIGQSYGGEVVMRAYLFALPFIAILAAMALFPRVSPGSLRTALTLGGIVLLMAAGFLVARYGNERFEMVSPGELSAMRWVYAHTPAGSKLAAPSRNLPWRYEQIEGYQYSPIADGILDHPRAVLTFIDKHPGNAYFIPSNGQQLFGRELYGLPPHWLDQLERALVRTGRLRLVYGNREARVYQVLPAPVRPPRARYESNIESLESTP